MSRIVLANGCFDIFHYGHLRHLEAARKLGDRLWVSITRNEFVNKGKDRPYFDELQRLEVIKSLRCVSFAFLTESSIEALKVANPKVFAKGKDYQYRMSLEDGEYCKQNGIEIAFTDEPSYSSTKILNGLR